MTEGGEEGRETVDWGGIEAKWRARWQEAKEFEAEPDGGRQKRFITVAYPYPNSPQHIGHGRTYTLADVHARFCRMRGYNVLFPMAFHYTGTPILGMARRVEAKEQEIIDNLKNLYGVPDEAIEGFADPVNIADYFHEEIKEGMVEMGYSIDWRREFTTIDPGYSRFIEWQVGLLREKRLIIQGSHPVGWCPRDQNPVSQHDTLGDVEPGFTEYVMVMFRFGDHVMPAATLRPETVFGVVNMWVNPGVTYQKIMVDGQRWIVSAECARKLEFLGREVTIEGEIGGAELAGKEVTGPLGGKPIPILPAGFVESGTGTGVVMSVPAHAPLDHRALEDLAADASGLGKTAAGIRPVQVISTGGDDGGGGGGGESPAAEVVRRMGILRQDDPAMKEATKEVYEKEFRGGVLGPAAGRFAGMGVGESRDGIKKWLVDDGHAQILLEMTNAPVRCRCGAECVVKMLEGQWFLNYGNPGWKEDATRCLESMSILPPEIKGEFDNVVGWLRERACARQHGLGTRLPWDDGWIVESLSDSVIYMAYYTIARFVNDGTVAAGALSKRFLDYVFLGRGDAAAVAAGAGVGEDVLASIRGEFEYFYPVDARHSGRDLVPNHLTFFVLNHVAVFPQKDWPRGIVVNGSVLMNGAKMSKSMGNIIPLRRAVAEYGADPIRLAIIISAELLQDADFSLESVAGIRNRLASLLEGAAPPPSSSSSTTTTSEQGGDGGLEGRGLEDRWIQSRVQTLISEVTAAMEKMRLREALHGILFSIEADIEWYLKRARAKKRDEAQVGGMLHYIHTVRTAMLSPFAPHVAEEMWERMGNDGMASRSAWPAPDTGLADPAAVQSEAFLRSVIDDVAKIAKVARISPKKITVYTSGELKSRVYQAVLKAVVGGEANMGAIMKGLIADPRTRDIKGNPDFVQKTIKDVLSESAETRKARSGSGGGGGGVDEAAVVAGELGGLAAEIWGAQVQVFSEEDGDIYDPKAKARHARPFKPALLIE